MKLYLVIPAAALFLCSCTRSDEKLVYNHDAEPDTTWINLQNTAEFEHSHSGNKVSVTDSTFPFSLALKKTISAIAKKPIKKVTISAWVWIDSLSQLKDLSVVASIDEGSKNVFWAGLPVGGQIKEQGKWVFVKEELVFPDNIKPNQRFTGYLLNNSKIRILIDDINFEFNTKK